MKINEVVQKSSKKLDADLKKLVRDLSKQGFGAPLFKVSAFHDSGTVAKLLLEYERFVDEKQFDYDVGYVHDIAESSFAPTRIVDKSYFGGANVSLLRRGKKIDTDALLSDIELLLHYPANRYA